MALIKVRTWLKRHIARKRRRQDSVLNMVDTEALALLLHCVTFLFKGDPSHWEEYLVHLSYCIEEVLFVFFE